MQTMSYYDDHSEQLRREMKARYNRRFLLALHIGLVPFLIIAARLMSALGFMIVPVTLLLIPHVVWVIYLEYRTWRDARIDRKLYALQEEMMPDKRKHYPEPAERTGFRLSDDGELEPVYDNDWNSRDERPAEDGWQRPDDAQRSRRASANWRTPEDRPGKRRKDDGKRRRDDDTDEFDFRSLMKKLRDIID